MRILPLMPILDYLDWDRWLCLYKIDCLQDVTFKKSNGAVSTTEAQLKIESGHFLDIGVVLS